MSWQQVLLVRVESLLPLRENSKRRQSFPYFKYINLWVIHLFASVADVYGTHHRFRGKWSRFEALKFSSFHALGGTSFAC